MRNVRPLVLAGLMFSPTMLFGQSREAPTEVLRSEIIRLTATHCDDSAPAPVRSVNERLLERRREAYASMLERSVAQVRDYEIHSGIELQQADRKDLDDAIGALEAELARARQPLSTLCFGPTTPSTKPVLASIDQHILTPVAFRSHQRRPAPPLAGRRRLSQHYRIKPFSITSGRVRGSASIPSTNPPARFRRIRLSISIS